MKVTGTLTDLVQQSCGVQNRRAGFHGILIPVFSNSASSANPGCKPLSGGSRAQNIPHRPAYPASFAGYIPLGLAVKASACSKFPSHPKCLAMPANTTRSASSPLQESLRQKCLTAGLATIWQSNQVPDYLGLVSKREVKRRRGKLAVGSSSMKDWNATGLFSYLKRRLGK